jgi:hypothetical protein
MSGRISVAIARLANLHRISLAKFRRKPAAAYRLHVHPRPSSLPPSASSSKPSPIGKLRRSFPRSVFEQAVTRPRKEQDIVASFVETLLERRKKASQPCKAASPPSR